jgi:hypothetical protein
MKQLIILLIATAFSAGIFAAPFKEPPPDTSAKIQSIFHREFPEVNKHSLTKEGDFYVIFFKEEKKQSSCRIYYDADGNTVRTMHYYKVDQLAPFIRTKIGSKYKGKTISNVTEVATENEHFYEIALQDSKSLWMVHAEDDGTMFIQKKFKKDI